MTFLNIFARCSRVFSVLTAAAVSVGICTMMRAAAQPGPINHVVVVPFENTDYSDSYNLANMPYMTALIQTQGALATNYHAVTHPSIGNCFELLTGQILTNDDSQTPPSFPVSADNIVRELEAAGLTWKAYCEDIPYPGYMGGDTGNYIARHCALPYLTDVQYDPTQQQNVVPFTDFAADIANNSLPSFSFVVANSCDDAHNCPVPGSPIPDEWLETNLPALLNSPTFYNDTLLIFLWDEAGADADGTNNVEWAVFGAGVKQGYQQTSATYYQHQSTLRLILKKLGASVFPGDAATAPDMDEFFQGAVQVPPPSIALVQSNTTGDSGVTSVSTPFGYANTAGNLILAFVRMSTTDQVVAVYDTAGNVYSEVVSQVQDDDGHQIHLFYSSNIAGGANTVTAAFYDINNHPWLAVYEYSGLSAVNPLDQYAAAEGTGTITITQAISPTVGSNELIFVGAGFPASFTGSAAAVAPYVLTQQDILTSRAANETVVASSTGSYSGTFQLDSPANWTALIATFAADPPTGQRRRHRDGP